MELTVHLDGNPTIREEGFFESKVSALENQIKALQHDNVELIKTTMELRERVTKLASQKGNQPRRNDRFNNKRD
jgi:hypothetical protein